MRDDRSVYAKTIQQSVRQWAVSTEELAQAASLPCAPALGVHRPYCKCGAEKKNEKEE